MTYNPTYPSKNKPLPRWNPDNSNDPWNMDQQATPEERLACKESDREVAARQQAEKEEMDRINGLLMGVKVGLVAKK